MKEGQANDCEVLDPTAEFKQLPDLSELGDTIVMPIPSGLSDDGEEDGEPDC